jgi:hypothetical protein
MKYSLLIIEFPSFTDTSYSPKNEARADRGEYRQAARIVAEGGQGRTRR